MKFTIFFFTFFIGVGQLQAQPLTVNAGSDTVLCVADSIQLNGVVTGGVPPYDFEWISTVSGNIVATTLNAIVYVESDSIYELRVTDQNIDLATDSVDILLSPIPMIIPNFWDTTIVQGQQAMLWGLGMDSFRWEPPAGLDDPNSNTPFATPDTSITYTYVAIDTQTGCDMEIYHYTVHVQPVSGLGNQHQVKVAPSFEVFPNPFVDRIYLQIANTDRSQWLKGASIQSLLYNAAGQLVSTSAYDVALLQHPGNGTLAIETNDLPPGIYCLQLRTMNADAPLFSGNVVKY